MRWIYFLFGEGKDLNTLQMSARSVVAFVLTLAMIQVAGMRTFGKRSALDNVVLITLGAVMSRAIVGASPYIPVTVACFAIALVHRLLAWLGVNHDSVGRWSKGRCICLFKDGRFLEENMRKAMISHKDVQEGVRLMINEDSLDHVSEIYLERNGEISVVKKV